MSFANFDIAALNSAASQPANQRDEAGVRKMASEFEALLLRQLTSSINPSSEDEDGESLFGQGGGLSLSRQLFSEQMADTMAQNGGVGLADLIVKQVLDKRAEKGGQKQNTEAARAVDTARSIRAKTSLKTARDSASSNTSARAEAFAPERASRGISASSERGTSADRYPDAVIISRASDNAGSFVQAESRTGGINSVSSGMAPFESSSNASSSDGATVSTTDDSDNVSEVSVPTAEGNSELSGDSTPVSPKQSRRLMTEDDVLRQVRPRRVHPVTNVEKISKGSSITRAPAVRRIANAPAVGEAVGVRVSAAPVSLQMYVNGPIRSRFGPRIDPIDKVPRFHRGVDIAAPTGTPIGAAAEGRVVFAGWHKGHGNFVVIEHSDGTVTRYAHASKLLVREGDYVQSGQSIALVGSTGHSTGPHLHFEVIKEGNFVDPLTILPKAFVLARR